MWNCLKFWYISYWEQFLCFPNSGISYKSVQPGSLIYSRSLCSGLREALVSSCRNRAGQKVFEGHVVDSCVFWECIGSTQGKYIFDDCVTSALSPGRHKPDHNLTFTHSDELFKIKLSIILSIPCGIEYRELFVCFQKHLNSRTSKNRQLNRYSQRHKQSDNNVINTINSAQKLSISIHIHFNGCI